MGDRRKEPRDKILEYKTACTQCWFFETTEGCMMTSDKTLCAELSKKKDNSRDPTEG